MYECHNNKNNEISIDRCLSYYTVNKNDFKSKK